MPTDETEKPEGPSEDLQQRSERVMREGFSLSLRYRELLRRNDEIMRMSHRLLHPDEEPSEDEDDGTK